MSTTTKYAIIDDTPVSLKRATPKTELTSGLFRFQQALPLFVVCVKICVPGADGSIFLSNVSFIKLTRFLLVCCHMFLPVPKLVRLLEIALIIDVERFPAFRTAFDPAAINWDVNPDLFQITGETSKQGVRFAVGVANQITADTFYLPVVVVPYFL